MDEHCCRGNKQIGVFANSLESLLSANRAHQEKLSVQTIYACLCWPHRDDACERIQGLSAINSNLSGGRCGGLRDACCPGKGNHLADGRKGDRERKGIERLNAAT